MITTKIHEKQKSYNNLSRLQIQKTNHAYDISSNPLDKLQNLVGQQSSQDRAKQQHVDLQDQQFFGLRFQKQSPILSNSTQSPPDNKFKMSVTYKLPLSFNNSFQRQDQQTNEAVSHLKSMLKTHSNILKSDEISENLEQPNPQTMRLKYGTMTERARSKQEHLNYRHLKKYSVVLEKLQSEQFKDQNLIKTQSNFTRNLSPNQLSQQQTQNLQYNQVQDQTTTDQRQQIAKLNLRKLNQFIPFFAERDNVGNLLTNRDSENFQQSQIKGEYSPTNKNNLRFKKPSFSEMMRRSQTSRLSQNIRNQQSNQNLESDANSRQDEAFLEKFKCKDVFDQEYFHQAMSKQDETKDIKSKLNQYIAQYKNKDPIMRRVLKQTIFDKEHRNKQLSKTSMNWKKLSSEDSQNNFPSTLFSDMFQPNKQFLLTERTSKQMKLQQEPLELDLDFNSNNLIDDFQVEAQVLQGTELKIKGQTKSQESSPRKNPYNKVKSRVQTTRKTDEQLKRQKFLRSLSQNPDFQKKLMNSTTSNFKNDPETLNPNQIQTLQLDFDLVKKKLEFRHYSKHTKRA
eukprot:403344675